MHGDIEHAAEMADRQRVKAADLVADGIVHKVVPESDDDGPAELARAVVGEVSRQLADLTADVRVGARRTL